jgi:uncharacterized phage infection (PIP) family protein YhgE
MEQKMDNFLTNSKAVSRTIFVSSVVALLVVCVSVGFLGYNTTNNLQTSYNILQTDYQNLNATYTQLQITYNQLQSSNENLQSQFSSLQSNNSQLQSNYNSLQSQLTSINSQFTSLNSQYQQLQSTYNQSQTQITNLQSQIVSLQSQLSNATELIAQLQGPTGILPTYMDLHYVAPTGQPSYYFLQLSLKNTGNVPITQIFVTINSVQVSMPFTYLNSTISTTTPLPAYQTTNGGLNVTPPINNVGTYPLVIQAVATNSTIYTYQTTINAHV